MGAGSVHQANQKGNSMGLLMPMYTFGIVAFFVYTIMKVFFDHTPNTRINCIALRFTQFIDCAFQLVMRKNENNMGPYPPTQNGETFKQEVFKRDNKIPNLGKNALQFHFLIFFFLVSLMTYSRINFIELGGGEGEINPFSIDREYLYSSFTKLMCKKMSSIFRTFSDLDLEEANFFPPLLSLDSTLV